MNENLDEPLVLEVEQSQLDNSTEQTESESSPELAEKPEEKNTDAFQERINKVTAQKYEEKRRADAAEARSKELEAQLAKPAAVDSSIEMPKLPDDPYDSEAMTKYHGEVAVATQQLAQNAGKNAFEEQQQQAREDKQQADTQQVVSTYVQNAVRDGVDMDKLGVAEQALITAGVSPTLGDYLARDANGGKIIEYLHDNPAVLQEVVSLDPISAGMKIEQEVKAAALSNTPKVSNAPDPVPVIKGGGALEKDDFERSNPGTTFI